MSPKRIFPCALAAFFVALSLFASPANAQTQTEEARPRQVTPATATNGAPRLENELTIISLAEPVNPTTTVTSRPGSYSRLMRLNQMLIAAIDARLDAPYVWGASGPRAFDCSGFVWSVFQSAGIGFERASARSLWMQFAPVRPGEEHQFGTLVFFNNQRHMGIVADANGFYHASTSQGVIYSRFDGYWGDRVDGFRRVPLPASVLAE